MWTSFEPWQMAQLERHASVEPERVERALNALWSSDPELFAQVAIEAVEQSQLEAIRCASMLGISVEDVEARVSEVRRRTLKRYCVVVCDGTVAKLADGGLPVWEVVRVYRKLGSVEKLQEAFASVSAEALESALNYAAAHADEVELQISKYEQILERKRAEYPFAK